MKQKLGNGNNLKKSDPEEEKQRLEDKALLYGKEYLSSLERK